MHSPEIEVVRQVLNGECDDQLGRVGVRGHQFSGDGEEFHAGDVLLGIRDLEEIGAGVGEYSYLG